MTDHRSYPGYRLLSSEEMDTAAERILGTDRIKNETVQEQSMRWATEMSRKVNAEKQQAVVEALITVMLATGADTIRIKPATIVKARGYALHRHTDPATGDWILDLQEKGHTK